MRISATLSEGVTQLRALLDHPMESGHRSDKRGNSINANFLRELVVKRGDDVLLQSDIGANLSKNPYFSIEFEGAQIGDEIEIVWTDMHGEELNRTVTVEPAGQAG